MLELLSTFASCLVRDMFVIRSIALQQAVACRRASSVREARLNLKKYANFLYIEKK